MNLEHWKGEHTKQVTYRNTIQLLKTDESGNIIV